MELLDKDCKDISLFRFMVALLCGVGVWLAVALLGQGGRVWKRGIGLKSNRFLPASFSSRTSHWTKVSYLGIHIFFFLCIGIQSDWNLESKKS